MAYAEWEPIITARTEAATVKFSVQGAHLGSIPLPWDGPQGLWRESAQEIATMLERAYQLGQLDPL